MTTSVPGIFWLNFFGRPYVELLGADKFRSAPCHRVEELPNGGFLLVLTPTAHEATSKDGRRCAEEVKQHLGIEYFFHPSDGDDPGEIERRGQRKTPQFDFSATPCKSQWVPETVEEPIPDPGQFIREVPQLVEKLRERLGDWGAKLDCSRRSLEDLDAWATEKYQETCSDEFWESKELTRELAAYLGEIVRTISGGQWTVEKPYEESDELRPVVRFRDGRKGFFNPLDEVQHVILEGFPLDEEEEAEGKGFAPALWVWMTSHLRKEAIKDLFGK